MSVAHVLLLLIYILTERLFSFKNAPQAGEDDSVVRSMPCSCREPELSHESDFL